MTATEHDAKYLYQRHLDEMGAAVAARDFSAYASHFTFPHRFETLEAHTSFEGLRDLRAFFDTLCSQLERHEIVSLDRFCKVAEFTKPSEIRGYHETRLVGRGALIDAFAGLCTLVLIEDKWLLKDSQFAESHSAMPSTILKRYLTRRVT